MTPTDRFMCVPCPWLVRMIVEHLLERYAEHGGDPECRLQRGGILSLLDGVHGLAGDADPLRQLLLRHLVMREAELADLVADGGAGHHTPRRVSTICATILKTSNTTSARNSR